MVRACSRSSSTTNSHLVRNGSFGPAVPDRVGNWDLRKESRPETGRNQAGWSVWCRSAPPTTQLWARTVAARFGPRAVYSWKVQVPQTCSPERCTLVSSTALTW
jgi:hypothetical protein